LASLIESARITKGESLTLAGSIKEIEELHLVHQTQFQHLDALMLDVLLAFRTQIRFITASLYPEDERMVCPIVR
jgi:hypothetical protein